MPRRSTDTLTRQWALLQMIPRYPQKRTTRDLHEKLVDDGYEIDKRTTERDLNKLSIIFMFTSEMDGKTQYWFWQEKQKGVEVPGMTPTTAMVMRMAEDQLRPLLPASIFANLDIYFQRARAILKESKFGDWPRRVRAIQRGPLQTPPAVSEEVSKAVHTALLERRCFEVDYASRSRGERKRHRVHPLGLVTRNGIFYLVCTLGEYDDVRHLALHRMSAPEPLPEPCRERPDFDFDAYIVQEKAFGYRRSQQPLKLEMRVNHDIAFHLGESPLSEDQHISDLDDAWKKVRATVPDTEELRWWILGFGGGIEVLKPKRLRDEFLGVIRELSANYGITGDD